MTQRKHLTETERQLIDAYTSILSDPFEDKYEDRWEDKLFDIAIQEFKVKAQEIGFSDPFELLSRFKIESYESIRTQLKKGPSPCFRPGWRSPLLGVKLDPQHILSKCEFISGPEFDDTHRIVVLDFWASWCDPCVQSGPEISDLADEFSDCIAVVGINNESIFGETKEPAYEQLRDFLDEYGDGFRHTTYIDNSEGFAKETVYNPSGYRGIPCVIMLVDGVVNYVGSPQENFRQILEQAIEFVDTTSAHEE
ncbi:hypothetical protein BGZ76_004811 [Entomortierella beljakovae]|nr:hypothetical protein BGZ76_004811 [Entomortierella beljakovae]